MWFASLNINAFSGEQDAVLDAGSGSSTDSDAVPLALDDHDEDAEEEEEAEKEVGAPSDCDSEVRNPGIDDVASAFFSRCRNS